MQMSQPIRRMWQTLYTLVGGDRRWLAAPLTSPSTSEPRRTRTVATFATADPASAERRGPSGDGQQPEAQTGSSVSSANGTLDDACDGDTTVPTDGATDDSRQEQGEASDDRPDCAEARILTVLADNDGRMDQRDISDAADLSQSTTSRKLIAMESDGAVTRYEIGRRKIVFLPGEEPEAFESPIDRADSPQSMAT